MMTYFLALVGSGLVAVAVVNHDWLSGVIGVAYIMAGYAFKVNGRS